MRPGCTGSNQQSEGEVISEVVNRLLAQRNYDLVVFLCLHSFVGPSAGSAGPRPAGPAGAGCGFISRRARAFSIRINLCIRGKKLRTRWIESLAQPSGECISAGEMTTPRILFCNCTYAQVVPREVTQAVLRQLCEAGVAFDAVPDLCEMSARQDPALSNLSNGAPVKIAACYPRAVKWLFGAAKAPLTQDCTEIVNMRVCPAQEAVAALLREEIVPNLPAGKVTQADAPPPVAAA
jgi:hypothetical protein